jgi:hypothetical protein
MWPSLCGFIITQLIELVLRKSLHINRVTGRRALIAFIQTATEITESILNRYKFIVKVNKEIDVITSVALAKRFTELI